MRSALMIADYILSHGNELTPLHVIKLAYISHGYTLAKIGKPLFGDIIEAWKYGPVIPTIYHALKKYRTQVVSELHFCGTPIADKGIERRREFFEQQFSDLEKGIIDKVLDVYGKLTADQLSGITHKKGTPWSICYKKNTKFVEIPNEIIKEHYKELINGTSS